MVSFRPRTVASVAGLLLGIALAVWIVWIARHVLTWVLVSLFLAMALNPAVERLERRGLRRGTAAGLVYAAAFLAFAALAAALVPTMVRQVDDLVQATPGYVEDLTHGRGSLGFLERDYHVVEHVRDAVKGGGGGQLAGGASTALSITKSVVTGIVAAVTIAFMTFFMLIEGPAWMERLYALFPVRTRPRWQGVAVEIYRTVGGYVTGNLLISAIAGASATIVLLALGIPYALALGLLVAILDLIPLAGATLAAILVSLVALTQSTTDCLIVAGFFVVYQQLENHLLQPLVYGRTVRLSPLVVLISVLIGAEVAGVLGALGAIPIAGTFQILLRDWMANRPPRPSPAAMETPAARVPASVEQAEAPLASQ